MTQTQPLSGYTVLDLSTAVSGPFTGAMLAEYGARVIKVESPGMPDVVRVTGAMHKGLSAMFAACNRGKEAIAIDLKQEAGRAVLWRLIDRADVLIQNFRPGAMERLGFGWPAVNARNEALVYLSISGFGATGPMAQKRVYDPIIQVASGVADAMADPETGAPALFPGILCDKVTALYGLQAVTAALLARARGLAKGQHIALAMLDATIHFQWPDAMYNHSFLDPTARRMVEFSQFYRIAEAGDGHVTICPMSEKEMRGLVRALGIEEILEDQRFNTLAGRLQHHRELAEILKARYQAMTIEQLMDKLDAHDVPAAAVVRRDDLAALPQVAANESIATLADPRAGPMRAARPPARLSTTPPRLPDRPAPDFAADSRSLLEELGYGRDESGALFASGAVR
ncbi:MAG: CaiB/BaiF CoA transferase family protein [Pseudomonadota bacterium]